VLNHHYGSLGRTDVTCVFQDFWRCWCVCVGGGRTQKGRILGNPTWGI